MKERAFMLIAMMTIVTQVGCNNSSDFVYRNNDYSFQKINNDSLYNILFKQSSLSKDSILTGLRDSINDFEKIVSREIFILDSIDSKLLWPSKKRKLMDNHFMESKIPTILKAKFRNINGLFNEIDLNYSTAKDDSIRIGDMPLRLQRLSLEAELESLKIREQTILIDILSRLKR